MNRKKILITLSGDDYGIVSKCEKKLQSLFVVIGAFVLIIFALCFISSYFSFTQIFPNYFVGFPIALFVAWMITNLYLLLLYTFSKNVLPHIKGNRTKIVSVSLRLIFVCFIAVVVSKPLEAWLFSSFLSDEISIYKQEKIQKYNAITSEYFDKEISDLNFEIKNQSELYGIENAKRIETYRQLIGKKQWQKEDLISKMNVRVQSSNYYVQSIHILNSKYPSCWLLSFFSILIFLTPAITKKLVSEKSDFYKLKKQIETRLVQDEYKLFKAQYNLILQDTYQSSKTHTDLFDDAPFNTIPKTNKIKFLSEGDLIAELYDA